MATSRDIASLAGVSQATVSRVLQGSPNVSEKTRRRVEEAMAATGYVPNAQARAMRMNRTQVIGVVTGRITNPYYPELLDGLTAAITGADYRMSMWIADGASGEQAAVEAIRSRSVDAVVFTTAAPDSAPLRAAMELGIPVVLTNRTLEGAQCDQVSSDNEGGGRLVARYLLDSGISEIAVIGGAEPISTGQERLRGFLGELSARGIELPPERVEKVPFLHDAGRAAAERMLRSANPPQAIFCLNDLLAFSVFGAARHLGLRIPEDVWVVGYDDIPSASWEVFDLTTIRQPIAAVAQATVDIALRRIAESDAPFEHRRFSPELVVRSSTASRPAS